MSLIKNHAHISLFENPIIAHTKEEKMIFWQSFKKRSEANGPIDQIPESDRKEKQPSNTAPVTDIGGGSTETDNTTFMVQPKTTHAYDEDMRTTDTPAYILRASAYIDMFNWMMNPFMYQLIFLCK